MMFLSIVGLLSFDTVMKTVKNGNYSEIYVFYKPYAYAFLGCFLFFFEKDLFELILNNRKPNLKYLDRISFDIYLVHYILLFSPLSVMKLSANNFIRIILFVVFTIVLSSVIALIGDSLKRHFFKRLFASQ